VDTIVLSNTEVDTPTDGTVTSAEVVTLAFRPPEGKIAVVFCSIPFEVVSAETFVAFVVVGIELVVVKDESDCVVL